MISRQVYYSTIFALITLTIGTLGYRTISNGAVSWLDSLYMTVITLSTVGYEEVVSMSDIPGGRVFTILLIFFGMGNLIFFISSITTILTDGNIKNYFIWRRKMKEIKKFKDHFILCGSGRVGRHIINELVDCDYQIVVIDSNEEKIDILKHDVKMRRYKKLVLVNGDAMEDSLLLEAGILRASALICCLEDDRNNLLLTVSAKNLNPDCKVLSRLNDIKNENKFYKVGADHVVSPQLMGGLRLASEAVRPVVVKFLDEMLRDSTHRISEIKLSPHSWLIGNTLNHSNLGDMNHLHPISIKNEEKYHYSKFGDLYLKPDDTLFFIATPEEHEKAEKFFNQEKELKK